VLSYPKLIDMSTTNAVVTLEAVSKHIIGLVKNDLGSLDVTADSSLQDQGLDSLKIMSLVFKIEDHYDIFLDEADADDLRTVGDLAAVVVRRMEQQQ
jgi:acyl carrier protein